MVMSTLNNLTGATLKDVNKALCDHTHQRTTPPTSCPPIEPYHAVLVTGVERFHAEAIKVLVEGLGKGVKGICCCYVGEESPLLGEEKVMLDQCEENADW